MGDHGWITLPAPGWISLGAPAGSLTPPRDIRCRKDELRRRAVHRLAKHRLQVRMDGDGLLVPLLNPEASLPHRGPLQSRNAG